MVFTMKPLWYAALFMAVLLHPSRSSSDWNDPSKDQYHIQTDEGPERYFRYQTLSGQYRKEKRLEDGTVVGTYGWVDADGIFRMRDYIADTAGYRILKTKNVYVGRSRPINEALSIAKKAPVENGILAGNPPSQTRYSYNIPPGKPTYGQYQPNVEISLNSIPSSTIEPPLSSTVHLPPSSTELPPVSSTPALYIPSPPTGYLSPSSKPPAAYIPPSTTPSPVYIPSYFSTPSPHYVPTAKPDYYGYITSGTVAPPLQSNAIYSSDPQYEHYSNPYIHQNGPTYPIDKYGQTYNGLGNGYDRQFSLYDGVSVTNDGFRYYIPKQYHEEQNVGDHKTGSFGYVDPFGIRRVIYYNAGPDGFKHRKNNRYVGLDATPYDPRPY